MKLTIPEKPSFSAHPGGKPLVRPDIDSLASPINVDATT